MLVKISVDENSSLTHIISEEVYEEILLKCIIVSDDLVLTLRQNAGFIHDASTLERKYEVKWNDVFPVHV